MSAFRYIRGLIGGQFFKISGLNGLFTLLKVLSTLLATKIIAVLTGVSGVAMVGQMQNVIAIVTLIGSGGFNQGLTKFVAEYKDDQHAIREFIGTAFMLALGATVLTSLVLFVFSRPLAEGLFADPQYDVIVIVLSFTLLFATLNNLLLAIINGFERYALYFSVNVTTTVVAFVMSILLVVMYHQFGALLALAVPQSIVCLFTLWYIRKEHWRSSLNLKSFDSGRMRQLLKYTMIVVLSTIAWPSVNIFIRTYVINTVSAYDAGIWQATNNINENIVKMAVASISVYLIPKLSATTDPEALKKELIDVYAVIIPASVVGFLTVFYFRDFFILLLYSESFMAVRDYLALQMVGSFFWMCKIPIMYFMLAKGHTNTYLAYEIAFAVVYTALSMSLLPVYGIQGIQMSFAIYNLIYLLLNIRFLRRQFNGAPDVR